ncbi:MAG: phosphotransferase [Gammaproteobacteria bacterium]|nr:phosphotransferase [Gammaproteobacteria bacterium]
MQLPKSIRDNLRFLSVEVDSQVANLQTFFKTPTTAVARRILDRSGYAYNLKMRIHTSCVEQLARGKKNGSAETLALRAVEFIATDLERITELCRDCIKQMEYVTDITCIKPKAYGPMLGRVRRGIELVEPAIKENDTGLALKIGQIEAKLDSDYNKLLHHYIKALKQKRNTEQLASALFVAHSVEQMGDALLDISESILSANLGQPVNFERYHSLEDSVEMLETDEDLADVQIERIADTRSGSAISGISASDSKDDAYIAIFKDGEKRKLKEERQGVESWHEIYPGLAPRILSYKKRGQSAALLIEHLPGLTFEQILLNEPPELLQETLDRLGKTLKSVWRETRTKKPVSADFMQQLEKRLGDVYKIHPEFQQGKSEICDLDIPSFDTLVEKAAAFEKRLKAPFSVYIHGDFNVDNIIYDPMEQRINFIDLHRSRYLDYVQDVSVFMVSNYRLQILDAPLRRRIMALAKDFYAMARRYADKAGDETFELRLALGLARSFATSTRFILDKSLARSMFLRARFLIEQVLAADPKKAGGFKIPVKEIFVG